MFIRLRLVCCLHVLYSYIKVPCIYIHPNLFNLSSIHEHLSGSQNLTALTVNPSVLAEGKDSHS